MCAVHHHIFYILLTIISLIVLPSPHFVSKISNVNCTLYVVHLLRPIFHRSILRRRRQSSTSPEPLCRHRLRLNNFRRGSSYNTTMNPLPHIPLPTEIVILILSWLPAESALRFKSVCKLWYQLITSDSIFIQAHLRRSSPQLIIQNPSGPSCLIRNSEGIFTVNLDLISKTKRRERSVGITYKGTRNSYTSLFTSCHGLLYFRPMDYGSGWVCNPLLGEWMDIPMPLKTPRERVCGFYFHKSSNQYRLLHKSFFKKTKPHFEFQIFALGTSSWRSIQSSTADHFDEYSPPAILNGALHWPSTDGPHIIIFDMDVEDFRLIDQPPGFSVTDPASFTSSYLTEMEGCLCFCRFNGGNMEIWILKDYYNVSEKSWEMKYVISGETLGIRVRGVCFLDGEIVFTHLSDGLAYYNPTLNTLRKVPHRSQQGWFKEPSGVSVYQKSFISIRNLDRSSTNRTISTVSIREFNGEAPVNFDDSRPLVEGTD